MRVLKNQKGISLIEVLVASAVMGILALALMNQFDTQRKMVTTIEAGFDTAEATSLLRTILSDSESCKKTFLNVSPTPAGVAIPVITRAWKDASGVWQYKTAFTAAVPINPTIQFNSFTLKGASPSDGAAELVVEVERLKPGVMGGAKLTRSIPLFVAVDATGNIVRCHGSMGAEDLADLCNSIEGSTWDATNRKCKLNGYYTKTELDNIRPTSATTRIHRSWLEAPYYNPNAGTTSPNNPPMRASPYSICGALETVLSRVVPAAGYKRTIQADVSILAWRDSGPDDQMWGEMDFNNFYSERATVSVDNWGSDTMRLKGIYEQGASENVTIRVALKNIQGGCNNIDKSSIHMFVQEL